MNTALKVLFSFLTLFLGYLTFRVVVRKDYRSKGKLSNFATALEIIIFAVHGHLTYIFLPAPYPLMPAFPENMLQRILGIGLLTLGILFTFWAMSGLGFKKAVGQDTETLNRTGFYRFTRNPQLIFYGVALLGIAILWFDVFALVWIFVYAAIAHMMVTTEEEHLLSIYGDDYQKYCEEVPRYL